PCATATEPCNEATRPGTPSRGVRTESERSFIVDAVYLQTNDSQKNEVIAFRRAADGKLSPLGSYATGGRGTGQPHLASQSSIVVSGGRLLVVNAGSDDVSLFEISPDGLVLLDRAPSGGSLPTSV